MHTHTNGASAPETVAAPQMTETTLHEDDFATVGELLAARRAEKGLSFADIEAEIRVREDYLDAIETMDPRRLPDGPYAAGFVRTYAAFLGLDADVCSRRFRNEMSPLVGRRPKRADPVRKAPRIVITPQVLLGLATIAVAAALVWFGTNFRPERSAPPVPPVPEALREWAAAEPGDAARPSLEPIEGDPVSLLARVDATIHVRDPYGDIVFTGLIKRGEIYEFPMFKGLSVSTLNAAAVEAFVGDTSLGRLGVAGLSVDGWSADAAREQRSERIRAMEAAAAAEAARLEAERLEAERLAEQRAAAERERIAAAEAAEAESITTEELPAPVFGPAFDPFALPVDTVSEEEPRTAVEADSGG